MIEQRVWTAVQPQIKPGGPRWFGCGDETASVGMAEEGTRLTMKQLTRGYPKDHEFDAGHGRTVRMVDLPHDSDQR